MACSTKDGATKKVDDCEDEKLFLMEEMGAIQSPLRIARNVRAKELSCSA